MSDICVHLYALCWNEERMLPFFFRHYDSLVDRYLIFDNHSTDRSRELMASHAGVTLDQFSFNGSFLDASRNFYDNCWKASRGEADWVVVCNVDEYFDHADLRGYLRSCRQEGITMIIPQGYQMFSPTFPTETEPLCRQIRTGKRWTRFDKPQLFSPDHVREIHFEAGRHTAQPEGNICCPDVAEVRLLHYRYLGLDYFIRRLSELGEKIPAADVCGQNHHYEWSAERKREDFQRLSEAAALID
ncbi:MAG: glycosyltransferase family 2 protein [Planctomycetia bacterium]|nr:glycosyltransferase family 2 protein [Planctomycetia bacterium]